VEERFCPRCGRIIPRGRNWLVCPVCKREEIDRAKREVERLERELAHMLK